MPPGPWSLKPFGGMSNEVKQEAAHQTYAEWSRKYGDIMSFRTSGTQRTVILSSPSAVREVFIQKQHLTSGITCKNARSGAWMNGFSTVLIFSMIFWLDNISPWFGMKSTFRYPVPPKIQQVSSRQESISKFNLVRRKLFAFLEDLEWIWRN